MKITYYGHSCFGIETGGKHLVIDPFITPNELAKHIELDKIPCDYILLTHGHSDHVADVEALANRSGATIICNFEVGNWFMEKGLKKIVQMNPGGINEQDFGKIKMVNAIHSSSMPDGSYGGVACGILLFLENKTIYVSGDTALHSDMRLIGEYNSPNIALLCIGNTFTMGFEDAIIASDLIRCNKIIGMHYDTFESIQINKNEAVDAFNAKGKELTFMQIGGSLNF